MSRARGIPINQSINQSINQLPYPRRPCNYHSSETFWIIRLANLNQLLQRLHARTPQVTHRQTYQSINKSINRLTIQIDKQRPRADWLAALSGRPGALLDAGLHHVQGVLLDAVHAERAHEALDVEQADAENVEGSGFCVVIDILID